MKILNALRNFFSFSNRLQRYSTRATPEPTHFSRLLEEFSEHDFFLNESQKVAGLGSWIWDVKKDRIKWSDNLYRIYDVEPHEFRGGYRDYLKFVPANERDAIHATITEAYQQQKSFTFEHHVVTKTGEVRLLNCLGEVIVDGNEVRAVLGTSQDITEQRQLEQLLKKQCSEAQNSNHAKSKFLANMSHEIRTPISAICGFSELLDDPSTTPEERKNYVSLIRANANWLSELVENVLDLSKVEAEKVQVEKVKTDYVSLLSAVRDLVTGAEKDLPIEWRFKGLQPRSITTDPTKLRQILINIIRNAQKFTRTGRIIVCSQLNKCGVLYVDICDTGIGMTRDQQRKVFQAFQQGDDSTTRNFGGTGLGLTISKRFARLLDGDVVIKRSRPGRGTVFRVEIPLSKFDMEDLFRLKNLPHANEQLAEEEAVLENKSILLVDDSKDNRSIVERFLKNAGALVTTAENGKVALEILRHQKFDLVLMDLQMPIMDGVKTTVEIRKKDKLTPIVALTAQALLEEKNSCLKSGFTDYLTKPINRRMLLEHVAQDFRNTLH